MYSRLSALKSTDVNVKTKEREEWSNVQRTLKVQNIRKERARSENARKIFGQFELIEFLRRVAFSYMRIGSRDADANATCVPSELWSGCRTLPPSLSPSLSYPRTRTHSPYMVMVTVRASRLRDLGIGLRPRNDYR